MTALPIDMFARAIHFHKSGTVTDAEPRTAGDPDAWQLAAFRAETDQDVHSDHWEMHPAAEEVVCCLSGGMRLYLLPERSGDAEEMTRLTPRTCLIVPRGRWHRIELDEPTDLMSLTLRHGTQVRPRTG
ncbi:cupin [Streptomyces sp. NPDC050610]|uniref:cupin n=1 Tax=Streptomyces sp. NPDC050610 TaxID=3157097 RepID=UPI0034284533